MDRAAVGAVTRRHGQVLTRALERRIGYLTCARSLHEKTSTDTRHLAIISSHLNLSYYFPVSSAFR